MTEVLDGGPIYDSIEVILNGTIDEIFERIYICIEKLIIKICEENIKPIEQKGNVYTFSRLNYSDNEIKSEYTLKEIYDRIRMVDGEGYKKAYVNFGNYRIEFSDSQIKNNEIIANVRLYQIGN